MNFFSRMSPLRAYRDLRLFLATRERYEFGFFALALAITGFLVYAFFRDSAVPEDYRRNIIYVQQWPATRTDAEIKAQQAIDAPIEAKARADQEAARKARQAEFKKVDDQLTRWGL
jgi:hypothetical protein